MTVPQPGVEANWQPGPSIPLFCYFSKIRGCEINYPLSLGFPSFSSNQGQFLSMFQCQSPLAHPSHLRNQWNLPWVRKVPKYFLAESWMLKMWRTSLDHLVHLFPIKEFSRWMTFIHWMPPLISAEPKVKFLASKPNVER